MTNERDDGWREWPPDDGVDNVLVYHDGICEFYEVASGCQNQHGRWDWDDRRGDNLINNDPFPLLWRPLPEPPKGKDDE